VSACSAEHRHAARSLQESARRQHPLAQFRDPGFPASQRGFRRVYRVVSKRQFVRMRNSGAKHEHGRIVGRIDEGYRLFARRKDRQLTLTKSVRRG
jgi:hypothetical protein